MWNRVEERKPWPDIPPVYLLPTKADITEVVDDMAEAVLWLDNHAPSMAREKLLEAIRRLHQKFGP